MRDIKHLLNKAVPKPFGLHVGKSSLVINKIHACTTEQAKCDDNTSCIVIQSDYLRVSQNVLSETVALKCCIQNKHFCSVFPRLIVHFQNLP